MFLREERKKNFKADNQLLLIYKLKNPQQYQLKRFLKLNKIENTDTFLLKWEMKK